MRISELLHAVASWLESPDNEALLLAEYNDECLQVVANKLIQASALIKEAAEDVDVLEPEQESLVSVENLEMIANLAEALDASGDTELRKQASALDELLFTLAADPAKVAQKKAEKEQKIDVIRQKYQKPNEVLDEVEKTADALKAIDKSDMIKEYALLQAPLSTRYCPDHAGVQIARVDDNVWQCELDKKIYNFGAGYTLENGVKVPGGDVANQNVGMGVQTESVFDDRAGRLATNQP